MEQSIAEEERLLYEQSDLRIEVVELTRLAAIKVRGSCQATVHHCNDDRLSPEQHTAWTCLLTYLFVFFSSCFLAEGSFIVYW